MVRVNKSVKSIPKLRNGMGSVADPLESRDKSMSQGAGPVTAGSITSQMSGIGPGSAGAPTTGYPDPGGAGDATAMSGMPGMVPMTGSSGSQYSTGNPFAVPPPSNADPGMNEFDTSDLRRDRYQNDRFGGGMRGMLETA